MDILEMYKQLSNEDKSNLTIYTIYDSIYDVSRNKEISFDDEVVKDIQEIAYDLYLNDEYYNLSSSSIAYFLAECYANDNSFLSKLDNIDYSDILEAIDNDNYKSLQEDGLEK